MNSKVTKTVFVVAALLAVGLLGYLGFKAFQQKTIESADIAKPVANPKKGDVGYVEQDRTIEVTDDTKGAGRIIQVEAPDTLVLERSGSTTTYQLVEGEVAVQCTTQPLEGAQSVDMNLVTDTKIIDPQSVTAFVGKTAFVMAIEDGNRRPVHTIFVSVDDCAIYDAPVNEEASQ